MDLSIENIRKVLAEKNNDGNAETLLGEVAFQDRTALKKVLDTVERGEGVTRSNTKWKRNEYVIVSLESKNKKAETDSQEDTQSEIKEISIETCLKGWKALAANHADQVLILEVKNKQWEVYNHNAVKIGDNKEFEELINHILSSTRVRMAKKAPKTNLSPYIELLLENHNLVLTGAPGTGKTFIAKSIADEMKAVTEFVQFHPSYDYTDFVEGLRPNPDSKKKGISFSRQDGIFKDFCRRAIESSKDIEKVNTPFVFIIDEINRGELSRIFGELFFAIDPGYRGPKGKVKTQYQRLIPNDDIFKDGFYLPENLYIIGTMNDIDRSVDSMDFAVRRRFVWREITAEQSASNMGLSDAVKKRMECVNNAILDCDLSSAYQIGGAYFLGFDGVNYERLWDIRIRGLIEEYFRGNPDGAKYVEKIKRALIDGTY